MLRGQKFLVADRKPLETVIFKLLKLKHKIRLFS